MVNVVFLSKPSVTKKALFAWHSPPGAASAGQLALPGLEVPALLKISPLTQLKYLPTFSYASLRLVSPEEFDEKSSSNRVLLFPVEKDRFCNVTPKPKPVFWFVVA